MAGAVVGQLLSNSWHLAYVLIFASGAAVLIVAKLLASAFPTGRGSGVATLTAIAAGLPISIL
jgi:hypothetical protein